MKILLVNDLLRGGGVEKLMHDLAIHFNEDHEIGILTDVKDDAFEKIYPPDIKYYYQMEEMYPAPRNYLDRKRISGIRKVREIALRQVIESEHYDVLLCMKESWIMMMALTYGDKIPKKFAWVHTDYARCYYTQSWFGSEEGEVDYMKRFDNVICVSNVIVDGIKNVIGDPGNLKCLYNPLDMDEIISKSNEPVDDIERAGPKIPLFVAVGRLNTQKGFDILLEVCNLLNHDNLKYEVWIIGEGESYNNYQVEKDLRGLRETYRLDNVHFLGAKDNPYKYMKEADYFLSTSRFEGYSYVSQEAFILDKPLVLTECSGVMELLEDKKNGMVVENSFKGIYLGMKEIINVHPSHMNALSRQMREYKRLNGFDQADYYDKNRFDAIAELFSG